MARSCPINRSLRSCSSIRVGEGPFAGGTSFLATGHLLVEKFGIVAVIIGTVPIEVVYGDLVLQLQLQVGFKILVRSLGFIFFTGGIPLKHGQIDRSVRISSQSPAESGRRIGELE